MLLLGTDMHAEELQVLTQLTQLLITQAVYTHEFNPVVNVAECQVSLCRCTIQGTCIRPEKKQASAQQSHNDINMLGQPQVLYP